MSFKDVVNARKVDDFDDRSLMCDAHGCPNRWSVDMGSGRLCSWHSRADKHDWPRVTQEMHDYITDMARAAAEPKPAPKQYTKAEKIAILSKLRAYVNNAGPKDPKAWAYRLRDMEQRGEHLSKRQRDCWREAIGDAKWEAEDA